MLKICYIGNFDFTRKYAGFFRVLNIAKSLSLNAGLKIDFIGKSNSPDYLEQSFQIYNVNRGCTFFEKLSNHLLFAKHVLELLEKLPRYDVIIFYGISARIIATLLSYCRKNNIKLIIDVVEWYDYSHLPFGRFGPFALDVHLAMTRLIPKCDGVIAISTYLEKYYKDIGCKVIRVPIIMETNPEIERDAKNIFSDIYLNLIYAGLIAKKDLIYEVINTVNRLSKEGALIRLHLIGNSYQELRKNIKFDFGEEIICYGRLSQKEVFDYLRYADFSIFLRAQKRYANAGFPTKFVESMNLGLPVITNLTSDLGLYLKDGYNGYVIDGCTPESVYNTLKKLLPYSRSEFFYMRENARKTAISNFNYKMYSLDILNFIKNI